MNTLFKFCYSDKMLFASMLTSILLLVCSLGSVGGFFRQLPPFLPLYNKLPWGYARIGTKEEIIYPIGLAIFCTFSNFFILRLLYNKIPLLSRLLAATTVAFNLFVAIYIIQIIRTIL